MGADHKGPLAAFVVIAIVAAVLLVTSVRSQAEEGWLAVHRLIHGHHSSTTTAGSVTPAGVRQPSAAPRTSSTAGGLGTDSSAAPGTSSATPPSTSHRASTTRHTPAAGDLHGTATPEKPVGPSAGGSTAPGAPVTPGYPVSSGLPDPGQPGLGIGPDGPFSPPSGGTPTRGPAGFPVFRWPFPASHLTLTPWAQRHWLALLRHDRAHHQHRAR